MRREERERRVREISVPGSLAFIDSGCCGFVISRPLLILCDFAMPANESSWHLLLIIPIVQHAPPLSCNASLWYCGSVGWRSGRRCLHLCHEIQTERYAPTNSCGRGRHGWHSPLGSWWGRAVQAFGCGSICYDNHNPQVSACIVFWAVQQQQ